MYIARNNCKTTERRDVWLCAVCKGKGKGKVKDNAFPAHAIKV